MTDLLATCWTHAGDSLPVPGRDLSPFDVRGRAEATARAGFTGIGFTIEDLRVSSLSLAEIASLCADLGLVHTEVELLGDWWTSGERRQRSDRQRADLLAAATALGARQIKIGPAAALDPSTAPEPLDLDRWAAELHGLAGQAADAGTRVALEPLPFANVADFAVAGQLVKAADHPAAGLVVDIWHLERGPSTLADLAALPPEIVFAVELNDAPAGGSGFVDTIRHRVPCGEGTFDVAGFIRTLQDLGFPGPWGVEILADAHRRLPLDEALAVAHRTAARFFAGGRRPAD